MSGVPIFMYADQIVVTRTENGFAVSADKQTPIEDCVAFETWDAIAYYMGANFAPTPQ